MDVFHDVVVVGLDLQDEKVEAGQIQINKQDVQVEHEDVDDSLEETLDELATLGVDEKYDENSRVNEFKMCNCHCKDAIDEVSCCYPNGHCSDGFRLPKLMSLSLRCLNDIPLISVPFLYVCQLMSTSHFDVCSRCSWPMSTFPCVDVC